MAMQSRTEVHIDLDKLVDNFDTNKVLKVGWVEKNRYPEEDGGIYVAEAAAMNEYGVPHRNVPPRPFMRPAIVHNKNEWLQLIDTGSKAVARGSYSIEEVLESLGGSVAGDIRNAIQAVTSPALSPWTIAKRLSKYSNRSKVGSLTKPLIDTGLMFETVTYAVEPE